MKNWGNPPQLKCYAGSLTGVTYYWRMQETDAGRLCICRCWLGQLRGASLGFLSSSIRSLRWVHPVHCTQGCGASYNLSSVSLCRSQRFLGFTSCVIRSGFVAHCGVYHPSASSSDHRVRINQQLWWSPHSQLWAQPLPSSR